jgi:hypothetical protein
VALIAGPSSGMVTTRFRQRQATKAERQRSHDLILVGGLNRGAFVGRGDPLGFDKGRRQRVATKIPEFAALVRLRQGVLDLSEALAHPKIARNPKLDLPAALSCLTSGLLMNLVRTVGFSPTCG